MARPKNPDQMSVPGNPPEGGSRPTTKQQRRERIQQKLAEVRKQHERYRRKRLIITITAWTVGVGVAAALVVLAVVGSSPKAPAAIDGVRTFPGLSSNHVGGTVSYAQAPPAGGNHSPVPLNCGVYSRSVPDENAVHSLEHGAVWVTYDPRAVSGAQLQTLQRDIPSTYAILSPYSGLPSPVVASAWGAQLQVKAVDDKRISAFISKYRSAKTAPEPGAPCSGGVEGPGRVK